MQHRRPDGELLGELVERRDGWIAVDLLGRRVTGPVDLVDAESALDERGLGYLADHYELVRDDGSAQPVRIVEVTPDRVRVKHDFGMAIDAPQVFVDLPNPVPDSLRSR